MISDSLYWAVLVFAIGATVGSFLNVVIIRLPRHRSIVSPGSRCGRCRSAVPAYLNIPIFSYFIAGGQCNRCGGTFGIRYAFIELLTGLVFLALWLNYGWSQSLFIMLILSCLLICASFIDLDLKIIPDEINLGGLGVLLMLAAFASVDSPYDQWAGIAASPWIQADHSAPLLSSLFGAAFGYSGFWLMSRGFYWMTGDEGLGLGDAKLMALVGAGLGLKAVLVSAVVGAFVGVLVGLSVVIVLRKGRRYPIPFGPFLCIGAFVSIFQFDVYLWNILLWGQAF